MPKIPVSAPHSPGFPPAALQDGVMEPAQLAAQTKTKKENMRLYSGTVLAIVVSYMVAGVLWAFLRPTYTATPLGDRQYQLGEETNVEFIAYLWFLLLTAVIAVVVSAWLVSHREEFLSAKLYAWVVLWIVVGQFVMITISNLLVSLLHPVLDDAVIQYAPSVSLGALGYVLAPCLAALIIWVGLLYPRHDAQLDQYSIS